MKNLSLSKTDDGVKLQLVFTRANADIIDTVHRVDLDPMLVE